MRRIFVHPDMRVNGAAASKQILPTAQNVLGSVIPEAKNVSIGDLLNGNYASSAAGIAKTLTNDPVAQAAIDAVSGIVEAVLAGQNVGQKEIDAAGKNEEAVNTLTTAQNNSGTQAGKTAEQIQNQAETEVQESKVVIDGKIVDVETVVAESQAFIDDVNAQNEEMQEQVEKNNQIIEDTNKERENLLAQINERKATLNISTENNTEAPAQPDPASSNDGEGNPVQNDRDNNQNSQIASMSLDGIEDPELQSLIKQYNSLGSGITDLAAVNVGLQTKMTEGAESISENIEETISVKDEQLSEIDEYTNNIVSTINSAEGAIKEVSSMLQGQFKTIDKQTAIKLAGEMIKASINGTQSGVLAAAAAAMGVGSIFSFGATAEKVARLTKNSGECATASGKEIAANVAGKLAQDYMQKMTNQVLNNLTQSLGSLAGLDSSTISEITSGIQQLKTEVIQQYLANNNVQQPDDTEKSDEQNNNNSA